MDYLPLALRLTGQPVLLVGGGQVALRKAHLLERAGACIHLVAPEILPELANLLCTDARHSLLQRVFQTQDLSACRLVVVATDDMELNKSIAHLAQQQNLLVNVVDAPQWSNVIFPAIIDRSPLLISITSSGEAPVLARMLRERLESELPTAYGQLARLAGSLRDRVKAHLPTSVQRRRYWEKILRGHFAELVFNHRSDEALDEAEAVLQSGISTQGEVYLVGAGPGDPELLTFKALRLMQQADVIVYDRLVSPSVLDMCRRDAERIYVGKARQDHALPQEQINDLLARLASEGKRVCRLKGGDPFIFGRGGEEIEHLARHGLAFQVVPGITAANGCAAYAGIPLTHRDHAQSVRFLTGHLRDGSVDLPWPELIHEKQTLVIYMALVGLPEICQRLVAHGMRPSMPIALVAQGTQPGQKVVTGTLETIVEQVRLAQLHAPTLTIVGDVVKLREQLSWFD